MVFRQPARVIKAGGTDNHSAPITAGQGQTTMLVIAVVDATCFCIRALPLDAR